MSKFKPGDHLRFIKDDHPDDRERVYVGPHPHAPDSAVYLVSPPDEFGWGPEANLELEPDHR